MFKVTPRQVKEGWQDFRSDREPKVLHRDYVVIGTTLDGNYLVEDPTESLGVGADGWLTK